MFKKILCLGLLFIIMTSMIVILESSKVRASYAVGSNKTSNDTAKIPDLHVTKPIAVLLKDKLKINDDLDYSRPITILVQDKLKIKDDLDYTKSITLDKQKIHDDHASVIHYGTLTIKTVEAPSGSLVPG